MMFCAVCSGCDSFHGVLYSVLLDDGSDLHAQVGAAAGRFRSTALFNIIEGAAGPTR
jgi:hypothetical protein